jgi:hypothetical protein
MDFADKTGTIGQLWIEFREDEDFKNFMDYNDLGCPMAYMVAQGLIKDLTPLGEEMINETFKMFLDLINVTEEEVDSAITEKDLGSILAYAYNKKENTPPDTQE